MRGDGILGRVLWGAFEHFVEGFDGLFPIVEPDRSHAEGLGGFDVVKKIVHEHGFGGGEVEVGEDGEVNAGVGFHHAHFGGDEELLERVAEFPFVEQGGAGIGHSVGEGDGAVVRAQTDDVVEKLPVEHIPAEKGGAGGFDFVRAEVERDADVFPVVFGGNIPALGGVPAFPSEEDFFQFGRGYPHCVGEHLAGAAILGADEYTSEVEDYSFD